MFKRFLACTLAVLVTMSLVLSGCSKQDEEVNTNDAKVNETKVDQTKESEEKNNDSQDVDAAEAELEPVELTYYFANSPVKDLERINEEINKTIKEKINATVELKCLDWSQYAKKINLMISSGQPFDLAFNASWGDNNYFQNAANGAFLPLDELLEQYAPVSKTRVPESIWDGVRVNGKIYGVVNYQVWGMANARGIQLRQDLVDKYNFDWKAVSKWDDLTPYLEAVQKGEPDMVCFEYDKNVDNFAGLPTIYGMDAVGDTKSVGWVRLDDQEVKVINQYKTEEYKDYLKTFSNWYQKGYIRKDAATLKDTSVDRKADRVGALYANAVPDMVDMPELATFTKMSMSQNKLSYTKRFTEPFISASAPSATVTCIGANSKNPERAMMLVELLNTDDYLYNTIAWGMEGIDYKRISDKQIEVFEDAPYKFNYCEWQMGQSYGRLWWDQNTDVELREKSLNIVYEYDKTAKTSPVIGFVFDPESVKTEMANCNTVFDELLAALGSGTINPDEYLPVFLEKLDKAGAEKIIAEKQRQIDAWRAANGK